MSENADARQNALDRVLDAAAPTAQLGEELFAVTDALSGSPSLRRALVDAGSPEGARRGLVATLFASRVSPGAVQVIAEATGLHWASTGAFVAAIERQGVRAILSEAQRSGQLDEVENQLFKVGRLVAANGELRAVLAERRVDLAPRQQLLADVLGDRVLPATQALARRAVVARLRTFDLTLDAYQQTAAELRQRSIATVEVAQPMTDEQVSRLTAALSRQQGRDITVNIVVNPAVIGGVRVSIDDEVIEGTVAGRLSDVRRKLS